MVDLDAVLERFNLELKLRKELQQELSPMRFTEYDLKEIIYLLNELKYLRKERNEQRGNDKDTNG